MNEYSGLETNLENVIGQSSLKWIFVGGKGGVGKTTCSCALAIRLSKVRESVLLVSTDPAHNLSDALGMKLTSRPSRVEGNIFAMEISPEVEDDDGVFKEVLGSVPGIDEAVGYAGVLTSVCKGYSVVVLDTAPTGHTLRLLAFPRLLERLGRHSQWRAGLAPLLAHMARLFGLSEMRLRDALSERLDELVRTMLSLNCEFKNPQLTTFVCVCLPEFLSLYETERLIQELAEFEIDTRNIIVNQLQIEVPTCATCSSRFKQQSKYLEQIDDLYTDFHVTKVPYQLEEVRGVEKLTLFSEYFVSKHTLKKS